MSAAAGEAVVTVVSPTVHVRVCTKREPLKPESVALLLVDGLRTQSMPFGPTGSRTSACTTVPAGEVERLEVEVARVAGGDHGAGRAAGPPRHVDARGSAGARSPATGPGRLATGAGGRVLHVHLARVPHAGDARRPCARGRSGRGRTRSSASSSAALGRRWPHGYVPPPSCVPILPPERLSSPSQRHHLSGSAIICAALSGSCGGSCPARRRCSRDGPRHARSTGTRRPACRASGRSRAARSADPAASRRTWSPALPPMPP